MAIRLLVKGGRPCCWVYCWRAKLHDSFPNWDGRFLHMNVGEAYVDKGQAIGREWSSYPVQGDVFKIHDYVLCNRDCASPPGRIEPARTEENVKQIIATSRSHCNVSPLKETTRSLKRGIESWCMLRIRASHLAKLEESEGSVRNNGLQKLFLSLWIDATTSAYNPNPVDIIFMYPKIPPYEI